MVGAFVQEASMAKYIVQQYIAAAGGEHALNSIYSMYAMGKVKMMASEFIEGDGLGLNNGKVMKIKTAKNGAGEMGGFVLWQKRPDLWSIELVVSGCKISAGSNGKVSWRQTPWHHSHASRGPARPLRRSLQVLFFRFKICHETMRIEFTPIHNIWSCQFLVILSLLSFKFQCGPEMSFYLTNKIDLISGPIDNLVNIHTY